MKIHEHQARDLLTLYNIEHPNCKLVFSPEEAARAAHELSGDLFVIKAQIHAGGRGKAGGVKFAHTPMETFDAAKELLGKTLVTPQTGPQGKLVRRLLVSEGCDIEKEYYFSMVMDSDNARVSIIACAEGGMEIEEIAASEPEKILRAGIDYGIGLRDFQVRNLANQMGIKGKAAKELIGIAKGLYRLFIEKDCSLVEINPLVMTSGGHLMAIDIKMEFDPSALFRHPELAALRDTDEEDPKEVEASAYDLNYISLNGNIGCMVNGAGLAMATMDTIHYYGGTPANFLDVGGGASKEMVVGAFRILTSDPNVKGIFINIFGGILRCDILARGIVDAANEVGLRHPLVVRLEGTNAEQGIEILNQSGLDITPAVNMAEGAEKIVALVAQMEA